VFIFLEYILSAWANPTRQDDEVMPRVAFSKKQSGREFAMANNQTQKRSIGVSRRAFLGGVLSTGAFAGTFLVPVKSARAGSDDKNDAHPNPIPGGVAPFKPFGIFVHHNPLNPSVPLSNINDPSQITDFSGFVGLTHIRGGGTGTNIDTGEAVSLAYQADMGFSKGKFIGTDGQLHHGTFVFV
jgi:hypothetical protein